MEVYRGSCKTKTKIKGGFGKKDIPKGEVLNITDYNDFRNGAMLGVVFKYYGYLIGIDEVEDIKLERGIELPLDEDELLLFADYCKSWAIYDMKSSEIVEQFLKDSFVKIN